VIFDWFTTIAQIFNFLLLLFLLRRFLYRPILKAMDEREQLITLELRRAREDQERAKQAEHEYQNLTRELHSRREHMIQEAEESAQAARREMMHDARRDVEHAQQAWYRAIEQEKESLLADLSTRASSQVLAVARRALADLANTRLEEHILDVFQKRLDALEGSGRREFDQALRESGYKAAVRSAFDIPQERRKQLKTELADLFGQEVELEFSTTSDLLAGIELKAHGRKIAWNLASYLRDFEEELWDVMARREREISPSLEPAGAEPVEVGKDAS
jgi:F-type H+-transporting ATPase subunit b